MKKLIAVAAIGLLALTGCSPGMALQENAYPVGGGTYVQVVTLPDDTTVDRVYNNGTITCDWERRS